MLKSMVQSYMLRSCMLYLAKKEKIHYYGYIYIYNMHNNNNITIHELVVLLLYEFLI